MPKRQLEDDATGFSGQLGKRSPWRSGLATLSPITIQCHHRSHEPLSFTSHEAYEAHVESFHNNRCVICDANLPTSHFLELHLRESHDPFTSLARERGQRTYACFLESCGRTFRAEHDRSRHLIHKHGFPGAYAFSVVQNGLDGRRSLLQPDTPEYSSISAFDEEPDAADAAVSLAQLRLSPAPPACPDPASLDSLNREGMLRFVPRSVQLHRYSAANGR